MSWSASPTNATGRSRSLGKPVVTRSVHELRDVSSRDIHRLVTASMHGGSSLYALDEEALAAAEPDLILTQELCRVCAVSYREVNEVARAIDADITVVSLEPTSIEGIFNTITTVGAMAEAEDAGARPRRGPARAPGRRRGGASPARREGGRAAGPGRRASSGSTRRSPRATGCPSRSAGPAAGTCSARTATGRVETTWDAVAETSIRRCSS